MLLALAFVASFSLLLFCCAASFSLSCFFFLLFSNSSPSQTISDCLLRCYCFVVDVAMLLLTSRLTHSSTFDVDITRASWLNGYDATIKWLCDADGDVEDDLGRYSPMQFIAISRADSNDLPCFLAVSLIIFISLVEMSQCNNMPMLMTLIAPREVTCFVSGW